MAPTYQPSNGYGVQGPNGYAHADQEQRPHDEPVGPNSQTGKTVGPDAQIHRDDPPSRGHAEATVDHPDCDNGYLSPRSRVK